MKTARNFLLAGLLALACLAPVAGADASRALSGRPLLPSVRDFATARVLSTEDASGSQAALPRMLGSLLDTLRDQVGHR